MRQLPCAMQLLLHEEHSPKTKTNKGERSQNSKNRPKQKCPEHSTCARMNPWPPLCTRADSLLLLGWGWGADNTESYPATRIWNILQGRGLWYISTDTTASSLFIFPTPVRPLKSGWHENLDFSLLICPQKNSRLSK